MVLSCTCFTMNLYISTWSYENRVSKHFVIFLNFPCLIVWHMSTLFLACFVVRDLGRSGCRQNYYLNLPLPSWFFSLPTILSLTQVTVIRNQRAPQAGFGAVSQFCFIYWSPWETFPGEHHVKLWDGTELLRFAASASSNIALYSRFIWLNGSITLIRAETERCDIVR